MTSPTTEPSTARRAAPWGLPLLAAASVLTVLPVLLRDGWPRSHEHFAHFQRIEAFRRAFAQGIWYPVWTPFAARGFGSPYPLFYHRLYTTLGALLTPVAGSVIASVKALTVLMLFVGGAGMRRLLKVSGAGEAFAAGGGLLFLLAPYTVADWLVRGAMAEFAAMMLLPWLYADLCLFLRGERHWVRLAIGVVLLFHAHSVLCYFFLLGCVVFVVVSALPRWRSCWQGLKPERARIAAAVAIAFAGIAPQVFVVTRLLPFFNTDVMTQVSYARIENNYRPFTEYFASSIDWVVWQPDVVAVELNRYILAGIAAMSLFPGGAARWKRVLAQPMAVFFLAWTVLCLVLQLPALEFVFEALPQGRLLQFPWRLTAFMTTGAIYLLVVLARELAAEPARAVLSNGVVGVIALLTVAHFGTVPLRRPENSASKDINAALVNLNGPNSSREYVLKEVGESNMIAPHRPFVLADGCEDRLSAPENFDGADFRLTAMLDAPCRISLRQFQTPMLVVSATNTNLLTHSPALQIDLELLPGGATVRLRPRTFWELFVWSVKHGG